MEEIEYLEHSNYQIDDSLSGWVSEGEPTEIDDDFDMLSSSIVIDNGLSREQQIVLTVLQIGTALLSLVGSSVIVYKILRNLRSANNKKGITPYDCIMLGLSSCDLISSAVYAITPFLLPQATSPRPWAMGNEKTCQFMGLMTQLAMVWAIWYNCLLSFYYLLTVRFGVSRQAFRKKYELWFHLSGVIFFPVTSLVGWYGKWYHEHDLMLLCQDLRVMTGCDEFGENCTGDADQIVGTIFAAIPGAVTMISILVNNIIIYCFVRKSFHKKLSSPSPRPSLTHHDYSRDSMDNFNDDDKSTASSDPRRDRTEKRQRQFRQHKLTRETATQGFLYVVSFYVSYIPLIILMVVESGDDDTGEEPDEASVKARLYPVMVLSCLLTPLQGFFNVFIYVRPTYTRFRAKNPDESVLRVVKLALFDPNIPRLESSGGGTSSQADNGASSKNNSSIRKGSNFSTNLEVVAEEEGEEDDLDNDDIESKDDDDSTPTLSGSQTIDLVMSSEDIPDSEAEGDEGRKNERTV